MALRLAPLVGLVFFPAACSAAQIPAETPGPVLQADAEVAEEPVAVVREQDTPARERWDSPFAVSGTGGAVARGTRDVLVLGADSLIAEGLERVTTVEARPTAPATGASARQTTADRAEVASPGEAGSGAGASATPPAAASAASVGSAPAGRPAAEADTLVFAFHQVEAGETWSRIVIRYRLTSQALADANPGVNPDALRTGQILRIPVANPAPVSRSHRVGPGETLRGIATRYDVTADEIRRLNDMSDERVTMGQTLIIPPARGQGEGR